MVNNLKYNIVVTTYTTKLKTDLLNDVSWPTPSVIYSKNFCAIESNAAFRF